MPRQRIWDLEKACQEKPPPYHQHYKDLATPTVVTGRCWFTSFRRSLRRTLGFDTEDFQLTPLWTPVARGHLTNFTISDEISVTLDPLCPTRKVFTRTISVEYHRGHSDSDSYPFLVLRPRDSKSRTEARVQVSVSSVSREWLSSEPPNNFGNLICRDAVVGDDLMPDIEPWLVSCHASNLLRGLDSHTALLKLSKEEEFCLPFLFDENFRRNVLCRERCNSQATCSHMSTKFYELEDSRAKLARYRSSYWLAAEMINRE
ncbi:hypothetical protein B0T18DRAFT_398965 [Schizothecium vesticola]|uniref:Uncharacterized protein n=1 Tax=Schizothecium vesticola TaxID=314040 RepID=A0AA40FAQ8_9PEZI|nr:hypothetical protein B0T18DRAFT_398965 [Schizothecium vesticola]